MNKNSILQYKNTIIRIKNAIKTLKNGNGIIILDDKKRENEGDIVFSAESMTVEQMALTIRYGSGIVCLCITEERKKQLKLPMMVKKNSNKFKTPFTISIEASKGITTGVSAQDRLQTIKMAISNNAKPEDLNKPGHVFPLVAKNGGVLERPGHTEATIDLLKLAGFKPFGVLCELTNKNGTMARKNESIMFAQKNNMSIITIKDIILYKKMENKKTI